MKSSALTAVMDFFYKADEVVIPFAKKLAGYREVTIDGSQIIAEKGKIERLAVAAETYLPSKIGQLLMTASRSPELTFTQFHFGITFPKGEVTKTFSKAMGGVGRHEVAQLEAMTQGGLSAVVFNQVANDYGKYFQKGHALHAAKHLQNLTPLPDMRALKEEVDSASHFTLSQRGKIAEAYSAFEKSANALSAGKYKQAELARPSSLGTAAQLQPVAA